MSKKVDVDLLIKNLKHEIAKIREDAARMLGKLLNPKAIEPLIEAIKDYKLEYHHACCTAADSLAKYDDERVESALKEIIIDKTKDLDFRKCIINSLRQRARKKESTINCLMDCLIIEKEKPDPNNIIINSILSIISDVLTYNPAINNYKKEIIENLIDIAGKSSYTKNTISAINLLGELKDSLGLPILFEKRKSPELMHKCFIAIEKIGIEKIFPILHSNKDWQNRLESAKVLGEITEKITPIDVLGIQPYLKISDELKGKIVDALIMGLNDQSLEVKIAVVSAIVKYKQHSLEANEVLEDILLSKKTDPKLKIVVEGAINQIRAFFRVEPISRSELLRSKSKRVIERSDIKMSNDKPIVFIAYVNEDKDKVEDLHEMLSMDGSPVNPWMYEKDKTPGLKWRKEIEEIIEKSKFVIICLSNNSFKKGRSFFHKENRLALKITGELPDNTIFLLPVRLEECPIPDYSVGEQNLKDLNYEDFFKEGGFQKIIEAINKELKSETKLLQNTENIEKLIKKKYTNLENILKIILGVIIRTDIEKISLASFNQIFRTEYFREKFTRQEIETIKSDFGFVFDKKSKLDNNEKIDLDILNKTLSKLKDLISIFKKEKPNFEKMKKEINQ